MFYVLRSGSGQEIDTVKCFKEYEQAMEFIRKLKKQYPQVNFHIREKS